MSVENRLGIGGNNPPVPVSPSPDDVEAYLLEAAQRVIETKEDLLADQPADDLEVMDDEGAEQLTDYIKNINACAKNFEDMRKGEKKPYLELGKTVDQFFKDQASPLSMAKAKAQKPLNAWLQKQAEEERKRREAEAKRLREEAEEKARQAEAEAQANMNAEAETSLKQAVRTEEKAERFEKSVESGRGLAASRGQTGGVASIRKTWVGEITDIDTLDLEQLRHFISRDDLQKAVNRAVANGTRNLRGASIYEKSETVVR